MQSFNDFDFNAYDIFPPYSWPNEYVPLQPYQAYTSPYSRTTSTMMPQTIYSMPLTANMPQGSTHTIPYHPASRGSHRQGLSQPRATPAAAAQQVYSNMCESDDSGGCRLYSAYRGSSDINVHQRHLINVHKSYKTYLKHKEKMSAL